MNPPSSQPLAQAKQALLPVLLLFSALALAIALLGWGAYTQQKQHFIAQENAKLSAIADLKAKQISGWLAERTNDAEVQRGCSLLTGALKHWLATGDAATLRNIESHFGSFVSTYGYQSIALLDAQGAIRLRMGEPHPVTEQLLQAAARALREKRVMMTELYLADLLPPPHAHLDFVVPLDNIEGMVLVLRANPNQFLFPFIQSWPIPSATAETLLVRRDGDHLLYLNDLRHRQGVSLKLRLPLSWASTLPAAWAVLRGGSGVRAGMDYRGMPVMVAWHDVPGTDWIVVAKVDEAELLKPLRDYAQLIATAVLVAMLAALLAALSLLRRRETAQQFAAQALRLRDLEALHESEEKYRTLAENLPDICWHKDRNGAYVSCNRRYAEALKIAPEAIAGHTDNDFYPPELARKYQADDQRVIDSGQELDIEEHWLQDGKMVWLHTRKAALRDSEGRCIGTIGIAQDISARKQAEEELRRYREQLEQLVQQRTASLEAANADLENFSYSVSHDLRAPLRAIDGFATILREDYAPRLDDEGRRLFQVVSDNARKMGQLIDDILAFSRAGRLDPQALPVDMKTLALEAWQVLESQRAGRTIEFRLPDLPPAQGDPAAVRQVWQNLLANAVKFTRGRETALIEVGAKQQDGENLYYVRDNGAGFDMAYAGKLFGLFQRLHGMEEFEGTGVGLAIVKRFIIKQGGRVWAESKPGEGATFWFSLPAGEVS
ncbi:MAG: PAS domain-containing protein [Sulfurimicrobium sp.]|nr:PAS domain-containing protein [Sulfurimicrobium sp.]